MVVVTSRTIRWRHKVSIRTIILLTTNLVSEVYAEVHAIYFQFGTETTIHLRYWAFLCDVIVSLSMIRSRFTSGDIAGLVLDILIEQRLTLFIHSGILLQAPCKHRQILTNEEASVRIALISFSISCILSSNQLIRIKHRNTVLQGWNVHIHIPRKVTCIEDIHIEVHFHTTIDHVTNVVHIGSITQWWSHGKWEQHIRSLTSVVLNATGYTVPQLELCTDIEVSVGFPSDVFSALRFKWSTKAVVRVDNVKSIRIEEVTDIVITLWTNRSLQLQFLHPWSIKPAFFVDKPRTAYRPECTPAMVRMETAGSITTQRSRAEDAFVIIVLQTAEETFIVTTLFIGRSTLSVDNGTVQFLIALREHLRLAGPKFIVAIIIIFVT